MKVPMINRSSRKNGCTFTVLSEIAKELCKQGIGSEIIQIGTGGIHGCVDYGTCKDRHSYMPTEDIINECVTKMKETGGLIVGSPVYYVPTSGGVVGPPDRTFYVDDPYFVGKPAAAIASAKRTGATTTIDKMNEYFTISRMPVVPSTYWNMVHGSCIEDVLKDKEDPQTMRNLARNMAWLLKCIDCGRQNDTKMLRAEKGYRTNSIR